MRSLPRSLLLSFVFVLLIGGLSFGRWDLVASVVPLVTVIFLETQYRFPARMEMDAHLDLVTEEVREGDMVDLRVHLVNRGPELTGAEVSLELPAGLTLVHGHPELPIGLRTGGSLELTWGVRVEVKGRFSPGPLRIRKRDAFHLHEHLCLIELDGVIKAAPRVERLGRMAVRPRTLRPYPGNLRAGVVGRGTDFFCLRDHHTGDPLRSINWKASARWDRLMTNAMEEERCGDLVVLLDLQMATGRLRDRCLQAAATLNWNWLRERNRTGMIVLSDCVAWVPMGVGKRQLHRVESTLLDIGMGQRRSPLLAERAWRRYFPSQALVVVVTPLLEAAVALTMKRMVRQGAQVLLLYARQKNTIENRAQDLVERMDVVRRSDLLFELADFCRVVEWDIDSPLSHCLEGVRGW